MNNSIEKGKLFKTDWLGNFIETIINGRRMLFVKKGCFNLYIEIFNVPDKKIIIAIKINSLLRFFPTDAMKTSDLENYHWTTFGILYYHWTRNEVNSGLLVLSSVGSADFKRREGIYKIEGIAFKRRFTSCCWNTFKRFSEKETVLTIIFGALISMLLALKYIAMICIWLVGYIK